MYKSMLAGLPVAYVATAALARDMRPLAIVAFAGVALVAGAVTACAAIWLAVAQGWLDVSPYRRAIDRVIERDANGEPSDRVVAAQDRAWSTLDLGQVAWTDAWPTTRVPASLLVASIASWLVLVTLRLSA